MNITNFNERLAAAIEYNRILEICKQNDYCLRSLWLYMIVLILISCLFFATALMVGCFIRDAFINTHLKEVAIHLFTAFMT